MDKLVLKGLQFHGLHGFFEEERVNGNHFEIDVAFFSDFKASAKMDDLSKTIDYSEARDIVASIMEGPSQKLIETLCFLIGQKLYERFHFVQTLSVSVRKLNPPMTGETAYSEITMKWPR